MTAAPVDYVCDETDALLRRAEAVVKAARRAGAERLRIALEWSGFHERSRHDFPEHTKALTEGMDIYEYASSELSVALQMHPLACHRLMHDAVCLVARLPHTWAAVQELEIEDWVARKIVTLTRDLNHQAARRVDAAIAECLATLPTGRLLSLVEARVTEADIELANAKAEARARRRMVTVGGQNEYGVRGFVARMDSVDAVRLYATIDDLARRLAVAEDDQDAQTLDVLRARALGMLADPAGVLAFLDGNNPGRSRSVVYVHTTPEFWARSDGAVARVETDLGTFAATRAMIARILGHEHVSLRPVIDLADTTSADRYEIPADISEALHLIKPADIYPYAEGTGRRMDRDHTIPWPHGPTSVDNLGLMTRTHHRIKTHAQGWSVEQLPGHRYLWRTPHGRYLLTDSLGTHRIGKAPPTGSRLEIHLSDIVHNAA